MDPVVMGICAGSGALILVVCLAWAIRKNDFAIRGSAGKPVRFSGPFPTQYRVKFQQFLEAEVAETNWTIRGAFKDRRFIRLTFSKNMNAFTKQRIRNFLMMLLHP